MSGSLYWINLGDKVWHVSHHGDGQTICGRKIPKRHRFRDDQVEYDKEQMYGAPLCEECHEGWWA